jgi:hypothetical protein
LGDVTAVLDFFIGAVTAGLIGMYLTFWLAFCRGDHEADEIPRLALGEVAWGEFLEVFHA